MVAAAVELADSLLMQDRNWLNLLVLRSVYKREIEIRISSVVLQVWRRW